jgi:hypothetical protein
MTTGRLPSVEGGIQPTIVDAKGDIIVATAADTPARLAVGANNTVLTADSSTATGLKWATPVSGSYTELASGSLNGVSTLTIGSPTAIDQTYKHLYLQVINAQASSGRIGLRINGSSSGVYTYNRINMDETTITATGSATQINVGPDLGSVANMQHSFYIENYATTSYKPITVLYRKNTSSGAGSSNGWASYNSDAAYTSLTIVNTDAVNYTAGTYTLFGVK